MTDQTFDINVIAQQLNRLERSNRNLKYLVGIGFVAFSLLLVWHPRQAVRASDNPPSQVVETQELRIRDAAGKIRAQISSNGDTVGLVFYAPDGEQRAAVVGGPVVGLTLSGASGREIGLILTNDGPSLGFYDAHRAVRTFLAVTNDGPSLSLYDRAGNARTSLSLAKDGPGLALNDADGSRRASFGLTKSGSGLVFLDANGEPRASFGFTQEAPILALFDSKGQLLSKLP